MDKLLLDLGYQPLVNNLCKDREESINVKKYPLKAKYNKDLLINLDVEIPPDILYKEYLYRSGINKPYIKHCEQMFETIKHLKSEVIIDIGGNDGTLLKTFKRKFESQKNNINNSQRRFINVDASESFSNINQSEGIEFINGYFNENIKLPKANLITSTNVFQHTKDIDSFLKGIVKFLDGVWLLEFPYTLKTLDSLQFDQFYHEHFYYWLVTPLEKIFEKYNLKIIKMIQNESHGGSLRIWSTNKELSSPKITSVINNYKRKEKNLELDLFNKNVKVYIKKARDFLSSLEGKTAFFGAAAKGCVFLNAIGVNINNMPNSFIIDDTKVKQGLYIPGTGFKIEGRNILTDCEVQNIIILAHNFKEFIYNSLIKDSNFKGRIFVMLPEIKEL